MASEKHLALSLAGIVTLIAVGALAMTYSSSNATSGVVAIDMLDADQNFYLQQDQLVLIEPHTESAQNDILSMPEVDIQHWYGANSFTALVPRGIIPKLKLYAKVSPASE